MQIQGEDSLCAGGRQQVSQQPGGYGNPGLVLLVAPAVGVVGNNGGDSGRGGTFERVDEYQHLHDARVDRRCERLNYEDIIFAYRLLDLDEDVLIGKVEDLGFTTRQLQGFANAQRHLRIGVSGENTQLAQSIECPREVRQAPNHGDMISTNGYYIIVRFSYFAPTKTDILD